LYGEITESVTRELKENGYGLTETVEGLKLYGKEIPVSYLWAFSLFLGKKFPVHGE